MKKWFKECFFCTNEIKEKTVKCQYCSESLSKEENKKGKSKKPAKKININNEHTSNNELTEANNNIKIAYIFWCIWAWITLIISLVQQNRALLLWLIYIWVLLYLLNYKKNRMAAFFLFIVYIIHTIYSFVTWWATWILEIAILLWYFTGIKGTFSYHKINKDTKLSIWEIIILVIGSLMTILELITLFV